MVAAICAMAVVVAGCGASGWVTSDPVHSNTHRVVHRDPPTATDHDHDDHDRPTWEHSGLDRRGDHQRCHPRLPRTRPAVEHDGTGELVRVSVDACPSSPPSREAGSRCAWPSVRTCPRRGCSRATSRSRPSAYSVVVNLTTYQLSVYDAGSEILNFPAGVGSPDDPTPTGTYFVTMKVPAPNPGYGPFVLVTSDHSDTISDWQDSGDAIIAIHGPITSDADTLIGTAGAAISHGCVRMHDADLAQLAMIPPGTPVTVFGAVPA